MSLPPVLSDDAKRRVQATSLGGACVVLGATLFVLANMIKVGPTIEIGVRLVSTGSFLAGGYAIYKANEKDGHLTSFGWAKVAACGALGAGNVLGWKTNRSTTIKWRR